MGPTETSGFGGSEPASRRIASQGLLDTVLPTRGICASKIVFEQTIDCSYGVKPPDWSQPARVPGMSLDVLLIFSPRRASGSFRLVKIKSIHSNA
jgi:hypothetical protein